MALASELIKKKKGAYEASLQADVIDGQFDSISFGVVTKDGIPLDLTMQLSPYGLEHTYEGDDKDKVDEVVKRLETELKNEFDLTFEERPQFEDIVEHQEEQQQ